MMGDEWIVQLVFTSEHTPEELMRLEDELDEHTHLDATVSRQPEIGHWMLTAGTTAHTGPEALDEVLRYLRKVHVTDLPLALEVLRFEEYERRALHPTLPVMVGASEVADMLDVTRQRVHQLRSHPDFPAPLVEVAMGPLWDARAVEKFAREWERKPGRPVVRIAGVVASTEDDRHDT